MSCGFAARWDHYLKAWQFERSGPARARRVPRSGRRGIRGGLVAGGLDSQGKARVWT